MAKEPVVIKLPRSMVRYIDNKVSAGEFISRTDFIRYVLRRSIDEDEGCNLCSFVAADLKIV